MASADFLDATGNRFVIEETIDEINDLANGDDPITCDSGPLPVPESPLAGRSFLFFREGRQPCDIS